MEHVSKFSARALKVALAGASKEMGRYAIAGIHADGKGLTATDGRLLFRVRTDPVEGFAPAILDADAVRDSIEAAKRAGGRHADVEWSSNGTLSYASSGGPVPVAKVDAEFPAWNGVLVSPERPKAATVTLSAALLEKLCKAAKAASVETDAIRFEIAGPTDPVRVTLPDMPEFDGVVMPMAE